MTPPNSYSTIFCAFRKRTLYSADAAPDRKTEDDEEMKRAVMMRER